MDIIKITMNGYGCEIHRGVLIEENYKKIEKYLDNVWVKNLFRELEKETEIDVKATLKKKIDQDFTKYVILGACNPGLAFQALSEEIDIGLLLPCNVVVYEHPENGKTVIGVIDPEMMVQAAGRQDLAEFAKNVREKLQSALDAV